MLLVSPNVTKHLLAMASSSSLPRSSAGPLWQTNFVRRFSRLCSLSRRFGSYLEILDTVIELLLLRHVLRQPLATSLELDRQPTQVAMQHLCELELLKTVPKLRFSSLDRTLVDQAGCSYLLLKVVHLDIHSWIFRCQPRRGSSQTAWCRLLEQVAGTIPVSIQFHSTVPSVNHLAH